jgi:hypothetical protein
MKIRAFLLTAAAAAILATTGAVARPGDRDHDGRPDHSWSERHDGDRGGRPDNSRAERRDRDGYRDGGYRDGGREHPGWHWRDDRGSWHGDHDRYWRHGNDRYVGRDRYIRTLRAHRYNRWDGDPYWFQGRFVIRTYDRFGRPIFVELNPYTGDFIGIIRF